MNDIKASVRLFVMIVFTVISMIIFSNTYAKYISGSERNDYGHVAGFVFDIDDRQGHFIDISEVNAPGKSIQYKFSVTNKKGDKVSEVKEEYKISHMFEGNHPLVIKIVEESTGKEISENDVMMLEAGVGEIHSYVMNVSWPYIENDFKYSWHGISEIELMIDSWQID